MYYHNYNTSTFLFDTSTTSFGYTCSFNVYNIIVDNTVPVSINDNLVGCDSLRFKYKLYKTAAIVLDTLKTIYGCDSAYRTTNITINVSPKQDTFVTACNSFLWNANYYYTDTIVTEHKPGFGCDTLETLHLKVTKPTSTDNNISGCNSVVLKGKTYNSSTTFTDTIRSVIMGCDSIYNHYNITVFKSVPTNNTSNLTGCGSVTYKSVVYSTSTNFITDTIKNKNGCDSIYNVMNITVSPLPFKDTFATSCGSFNWHGINYKNDTVTSHHIINYVTTTLSEGFSGGTLVPTGWTFSPTISTYPSTYGIASPSLRFGTNNDRVVTSTLSSPAKELSFWLKSQSATGGSFLVEGYNGTSWVTVNNITSYPANGATIKFNATSTPKLPSGLNQFRFTYTKSAGNLAFDDVSVLYNTNSGCDSLITLHLTTKKAIDSSASVTVCNKFIYKNVLYNSSAVVKDTLKSIEGCDSIYLTVNATVNPSISGRIIHPTKGTINKVLFTANNGNIIESAVVNGNYIDSCLAPQSNVLVRLRKNNDITKANGINTTDVLLVQRHILNTTKLNNAYKLIAADVTGDGKINSTDILRIKRLILGTDTTFTKTIGNNKLDRLWEFVDSAYQFPDTSNPFPFKDSISFTNLTSNKINQTFIGVKLGDVSNDWNPAIPRAEATKPVEFVYSSSNEKLVVSNLLVRIPINVSNFKNLLALQYTLHFNNNDYEFVAIENNKLGIDFNDKQANKNGNISFLWTDKTATEKTLEDGAELFTLVLRSTINRKLSTDFELAITNEITDIAVWDKDFNLHNIILTKRETKKEKPEIRSELFSVSPNPTNGDIKINMLCKTNKTIRFELCDAQGRVLLQQSFEATKGNNTIRINLKKNTHLPSGIYFLKAIGLEGEDVKKLIVE